MTVNWLGEFDASAVRLLRWAKGRGSPVAEAVPLLLADLRDSADWFRRYIPTPDRDTTEVAISLHPADGALFAAKRAELQGRADQLDRLIRGESDRKPLPKVLSEWTPPPEVQVTILTVLARATGPMKGPAITDAAGFNEDYLRRQYPDLQARGWIEKVSDGFVITDAGRATVTLCDQSRFHNRPRAMNAQARATNPS